jgi:hypothetical protein
MPPTITIGWRQISCLGYGEIMDISHLAYLFITLLDLEKLASFLGMALGIIVVVCCRVTSLAITGLSCILVRKNNTVPSAEYFLSLHKPLQLHGLNPGQEWHC